MAGFSPRGQESCGVDQSESITSVGSGENLNLKGVPMKFLGVVFFLIASSSAFACDDFVIVNYLGHFGGGQSEVNRGLQRIGFNLFQLSDGSLQVSRNNPDPTILIVRKDKATSTFQLLRLAPNVSLNNHWADAETPLVTSDVNEGIAAFIEKISEASICKQSP